MSPEGDHLQAIDVSFDAFVNLTAFNYVWLDVYRSLNVPTLMRRQKELEVTVETLNEQIDRLKRDVSLNRVTLHKKLN